MAVTSGLTIGTSITTIYTTPATKEATVLFCSIANTGDAATDVEVTWQSGANTAVVLWKGTIPEGATIVALAGLVLQAGQKLKAERGSASTVSVVLSVSV